jgi:hypothetical protein
MNKNTTLFWVPPEIFSHAFLHVFLGLGLSAGALLHIVLHWSWIKNAILRFDRLPGPARANAGLTWLWAALTWCAGAWGCSPELC